MRLTIRNHFMDDQFPYVHVPAELHKVLGEPLPGTRLYRKEGPEDESLYWDDAIFKVFGHCVSPGGAAVRAGVSRAAVHQRLKDGKLTGFFTIRRNRAGFCLVLRKTNES
jgi:hypothetical protein